MKQLTFETQIRGFECNCVYDEDDTDYRLTNNSGYRIYWLENAMQPEDKYQLIEEIQAALFARKYGIEY